MRDVLLRPKRELQPRLQVEEDHGAMLEFRADDALRREPQAVAIEAHRALEIVDAEGDEGDARLHFAYRKNTNFAAP